MAWKIENAEAGVWHGFMTDDEAKEGGVWLLHTNHLECHPGRVTSDPWYQLWTDQAIHIEKGHRVHPVQRHENAQLPYGGRWEYVQVVSGAVTVISSMDPTLSQVLDSGSCVFINPTEDRTWLRNPGYSTGCRICSFEGELLFGRPNPASYKHHTLWAAEACDRLGHHINSLLSSPHFQKALLVVYEGTATLQLGTDTIDLRSRDYVYLDARWFTKLGLHTTGMLADFTLYNRVSNP